MAQNQVSMVAVECQRILRPIDRRTLCDLERHRLKIPHYFCLGAYFTREPAALIQDRKAEAVPLKDAPLDVRERFLLKSEEFFRAYLQLCEDRLGRMHDSVSQADRTLELLERMRFE